MDKITRDAKEHGQIFEMMTLFKKVIEMSVPDVGRDKLKDLRKFFEEDLVSHFDFEEKDLFPIMLEKGTREEKELIRGLQQEHIDMLGKIDQFKELASKYDFLSAEEKLELVKLSSAIMKAMPPHANKEDNKLFPILKKYQIELT